VGEHGTVLVLVAMAVGQRRRRSPVPEWCRVGRALGDVQVVMLVRLARMDEVAMNWTANVLDECRVRHDRELRHEAERRDRRRSEAATR
jgi:hypothetical protein